MTTSIFEKYTPKKLLKDSRADFSLFRDFFVIEHNGTYFLQLGLKPAFASEDTLSGELSAQYKTALANITEYLGKLHIVESAENYFFYGQGIVHDHISAPHNEKTTLYDATALSHSVVELSTTDEQQIKQLINLLKAEKLPEHEGPYSFFQTSSQVNQPRLNPVSESPNMMRR